MEPLTTLLTALAAGASTATTQAVQDAYGALKRALQRKWERKEADSGTAEVTLASYERKPEIWREPMKELLIGVEADQDQEILVHAEDLLRLLRKLHPEGHGVHLNVEKAEARDGSHISIAGESVFNINHLPGKDH